MESERINEYLNQVSASLHETFQPVGPELRVGVDLGTANIVIAVLDGKNRPVACEKRAANVVRDGVVVDYLGAIQIVKELKAALERRLGRELTDCAIAMPGETEGSIRVHQYVAESAGFEVSNILDEPTAANAVLGVHNGAVVDIGGGTTGIAVFQCGKVVFTADEPTGGHHLSLALAGHFHIPLEEAEALKQDAGRHREVYPLAVPVLEKMASIVGRALGRYPVEQVALCGGTCCLTDMEQVLQKQLGIPVWKPAAPLLVTPAGIAMLCGMRK